jgi:hypothetical protein
MSCLFATNTSGNRQIDQIKLAGAATNRSRQQRSIHIAA